MNDMKITIKTEFIRLDALLKLAGFVGTGGEAKIRIAQGEALVNGVPCTMRGKKIYPQDVVAFDGQELSVQAE